jgi:hypothetical protein
MDDEAFANRRRRRLAVIRETVGSKDVRQFPADEHLAVKKSETDARAGLNVPFTSP